MTYSKQGGQLALGSVHLVQLPRVVHVSPGAQLRQVLHKLLY